MPKIERGRRMLKHMEIRIINKLTNKSELEKKQNIPLPPRAIVILVDQNSPKLVAPINPVICDPSARSIVSYRRQPCMTQAGYGRVGRGDFYLQRDGRSVSGRPDRLTGCRASRTVPSWSPPQEGDCDNP